ncbi:hypothetical protein PoHVEF18_007451 [Penicillium ochrochloron]
MLFLPVFLLTILGFTGTHATPLAATGQMNHVERDAGLNAFLAILLANMPAINGPLTEVTSLITAFDKVLGTLTGAKDTRNELGGPCKEWTVIFARGTAESGNVGVLVGPPLFDALGDKFGSSTLTIQGVKNYSASVEGYLAGGDPAGSSEMARQIEAAKSQCPDTKLIASGYSQGCQIVHNAVSKLQASTARWISSVLLFGDPMKGQPLANVPSSRVFTSCHAGDDICNDGLFIGPAHLTYADNVTAAANFAATCV